MPKGPPPTSPQVTGPSPRRRMGDSNPEGVTPTRFPSALEGSRAGVGGRVRAAQRAARIVANGRERLGLAANCYQNCYRPPGSLLPRLPYGTLRRPSESGRRAVKCRAEKPADEPHRGGVRRQALARTDLPCDGWVEPIPVRRRRELRLTAEATVNPLGADRTDEGRTVNVLRPGEHHDVNEITDTARRTVSRRPVHCLRGTELVSDVVDHGVQAHRWG